MAPVNVALPANYNPKALQLDPEGNVNVHTGPAVTSFFGMLRRVYRIEVSNTSGIDPSYGSLLRRLNLGLGGAVQGVE